MTPSNGDTPTPQRTWDACQVDVYNRLHGLEAWTKLQGERCDRLHSALDDYLHQRSDVVTREITDMRERITRVETRIVVVVGIATAVAGIIGHVLARVLGG